jgi:glycosyltransferase involved in cell wall biosynthesis
MRLLIFTHYSANYGANLSLLNLMQGLKALDYQFLVIIPEKGPFTDRLEQAAIDYKLQEFYPMTYKPFRKAALNKKANHKKNLKAVDDLAKVVEEFQPDLIYSNSSVIGLGARVAAAQQLPHIWVLREMAELHYNYKFYPNKQTFVGFLKAAKLLIPISNAVQKEVLAPHQIQHYQVIYNGIFAKDQFEKLLDYPKTIKNNQKIVFLTVGLLHPSKQQALIIKAFQKLSKQYPDIELWIAGGGSILYKSYLQWLIFRYGLQQKVKLLGYVNDVMSLYQKADVVITASKHEGLGRTTIEAMALEKAVIGLNSGATTELIEDGVNGFLFEESIQNLQNAMEKLILNPQLSIEMGKRGRIYAKAHFIIENYVQQLDQLFSNCID